MLNYTNMPTVRDRNVRKLRKMRKKAKLRMKMRAVEPAESEECIAHYSVCIIHKFDRH